MPTIHDKGFIAGLLDSDEFALWRIGTGQKYTILGPLIKAYLAQGLTSDVTYYVNQSTGNDSTGDGSAGLPWASFAPLAAKVGPRTRQRVKVEVVTTSAGLSVEPLTRFKLGADLCIFGTQTTNVQASLAVASFTAETCINTAGSTVDCGIAINVGSLGGVSAGDYEGLSVKVAAATNTSNVGVSRTIIEHYISGSDHIFVTDLWPSAFTIGDTISVGRGSAVLKGSKSFVDGGPARVAAQGFLTWVNCHFNIDSGGSVSEDALKLTGAHAFFGCTFRNENASGSWLYAFRANLIIGRYSSSFSWCGLSANLCNGWGIGQIKGSSQPYVFQFEYTPVVVRGSHFRLVQADQCIFRFEGMNGFSNILDWYVAFTVVQTKLYMYAPGKIKFLGASSYMSLLVENNSYFYIDQTLEQKSTYSVIVRYHSSFYIGTNSRILTSGTPPEVSAISLCYIHGTNCIAGLSTGIKLFATTYNNSDFAVINDVKLGADNSLGVRIS